MTRENVWDYPRPPRVEPCRRRVRVESGRLGDVEVPLDEAADSLD